MARTVTQAQLLQVIWQLVPQQLALICSCLPPGSGPWLHYLLPFSHKSVSAISHCCRPMFPLRDVQWAWISFTPNWENHFYTDMTLCIGASLLCWSRKGPSPNCFHNIVRPLLSELSLYAAAVRPPFKCIRTKEPNSNHGKHPLLLSRIVCGICHQL